MGLLLGTTVFDGGLQNLSQASWAAARDAITATDLSTTSTGENVRSEDPGIHCGRMFLSFDLTSIGTGAVFNSGSLVVQVTSTSAGNASHGELVLVKSTQPSSGTLGTEDYDLRGAVDFGGTVDASTTGTKTWTLNSAAGTYLTSKFAGTATLCIITGKDFNNVAPGTTGNMVVSALEHATTAFRPVLQLDYTGGNSFMTTNTKYWGA